MPKPIVEIENLSFTIDNDVPILDNISLTVYDGDLFGIIGPNGGGKTTLFKLLLGIYKANKGKISLFGKSLYELDKYIGYVPQEKISNRGFPISVLDVVMMGRIARLNLFQRYKDRDREIAIKSLDRVGISDLYNKDIHNLSGGLKQRVYIARALATEPDMLLLDEPSTGIDPKFHNELYDLIRDLNKEITVMLITHDLKCLSEMASGIAYINRKAIVRRRDEIKEENFYDFYHTL
ncbi:MAG: metal ABC transporter ATP-binding protein [Spirochaetota bacterium]